MNLSNHLEPRADDAFHYLYAPHHIALIAAEGFDTLRIPANVARHFSDGQIAPDFAARLRSVVDLARAEGLFIILSLHNYDAIMEDPDAEAERFVAIWSALAEMFDDIPNEMAFELLNEPTGNLTNEVAEPLYARALAEIRARQPERWVLIGGADKNSVRYIEERPRVDDPRVVHTFHYYDPFNFTHQGATHLENPPPVGTHWGKAADYELVKLRLRRAANHHTPTFLGEFGVFERAPRSDRPAFLSMVRKTAESHGIGWCHWGFGAGFGAFEPADNTWYDDIVEALLDGSP